MLCLIVLIPDLCLLLFFTDLQKINVPEFKTPCDKFTTFLITNIFAILREGNIIQLLTSMG